MLELDVRGDRDRSSTFAADAIGRSHAVATVAVTTTEGERGTIREREQRLVVLSSELLHHRVNVVRL